MKALILCNGTAPEKPLFEKRYQEASLFIAADGGGNTARALGRLPDVVIGDLDSFQGAPGDSFEIIEDPGQETNDLEKALEFALKRGITDVIVLGVTGQRIDQTLKNLSVMIQYDEAFHSLIYEDNFGVTLLLPKTYADKLPIGTIVSLFPLSGRVEGVRTKGLKYRLNEEALENGIRDGSSNEVISSPVEITHDKGDLLLFVAHEHVT